MSIKFPNHHVSSYGQVDLEWAKAFLSYQQGRFEEAIPHLKTALKIHSCLHEVWALRARCYMALFEDEHALADITKAIVLNPSEGEYHLIRGCLHHSIGQFEAAIIDWKNAMILGREDARCFLDKGSVPAFY